MDGTNRIDELEQKFIENPRRYFAALANEYRKAGNPHQAIAICRAHLGQLPGHMSGQIVYGQALFEAGEYDQAQTVFENALAMDRENLVALRHLGDLALRKGETAAARQWYAKILEIDPKDAAVISLVNEIDSAAEAQTSTTDAEPASTTTPEAVQPMPEPAAAPVAAATAHTDEEDKLIAEELGYPVPPAPAFVTETMAELYLAQGFRDRALSVYRELVHNRPDDERLRRRLDELENTGMTADWAASGESGVSSQAGETAHGSAEPVAVDDGPPETSANGHETSPEVAASQTEEAESPAAENVEAENHGYQPVEAEATHSEAVEDRRDESPSVESPQTSEDEERAHSVEMPVAPSQAEPPSEESGAGQTPSIDSPPDEESSAEPESVEAPVRDEPHAEPEGRGISVREFFANLGRQRPAPRSDRSSSNGSTSNGTGPEVPAWSSESDAQSASDQKAAAALAGAFGGGQPAASFGSPPASPVVGKESEEDVARFRAWLDGLTAQ